MRSARVSWLLRSLTVLSFVALLPMQSAGRSGPATAYAAGGCSTSRTGLSLDSEEQAMLKRINDYRAGSGLSQLSLSPTLMAAAAWKSADLASNRYFAHDDLSRSWLQRLTDCGYTASPNVAENLAAGYPDAASTFEQWRTSSGHNANLLNPAMRVIGIARASLESSPYGWYWTADFGAAGDTTAASQPATAPSPTPGPTPAPPQPPATAPPSTGGSSRTALSVGATAIVSGTGDCLRVHSSPALSADEVACLSDGTGMVIVEGPASADGYTWWKLGALGWAVDRYLNPLQ